MRKEAVIVGLLMVWLVASPGLWSGMYQEKDRTELAKAMAEARVSLGQGLSASAREGKPISATFEIDEGKFQLSVYTAKGDKFSEVIVDHNTGKIAKAEPISSGDDYTAAKDQSTAMAKVKRSLGASLAEVLKSNPSFCAVSIIPALKDGHPIAEVTLVKGAEWKTVSEKLD